jgi:Tol biopolymer transport system component
MTRLILIAIVSLSATVIFAGNEKKHNVAADVKKIGVGYTISVRFKEIGKAETFVLSIGPGKVITVKTDALMNFSGTFPTGYRYKITQISGPRKCIFTPAMGTVGTANVEINSDGGIPDGFTILNGKLVAPVGTRVLLENNGKDTLTVISRAEETFYTFPKPLMQGTTFNVIVKSGPPGFVYSMVITGGELTTIFPGSFLTVYADRGYDLISRDKDNKVLATYYESWEPAICQRGDDDEGRYVAFISSVKGMDGSTGKNRQLFWRDRKTGLTKLISKSVNGEEGNANSGAPVMDVTGLKVAFESYADNLVSSDGNKVRDVFLWTGDTLGVGTIQQISTGKGGVDPNAESFEPTISGNGDDIAFSSSASNITDGVEGTYTVNVYLRTLSMGNTRLITMDPKTRKGVGGSKPSIDEDGNTIAFYSYSDKLVENDKNNLWDIFAFDKRRPILQRITMAYDGSERKQGTESNSRVVTPTISGNGRYITFASTSPNLVPDDNNGLQDAFVYDISDKHCQRVSVAPSGLETDGDSPIGQGEKITISNNGSVVAFTSNATNLGAPAGNIFMYKLRFNEMKPLTSERNASATPPVFSRNGRYAAFGFGSPLDIRFRSTGQFVNFTGEEKCGACF